MKELDLTLISNIFDYNIIDIRTKEKYDLNHIKGATFIERNELVENTASFLDKEKIYYLACGSGNSARRITQILIDKGYNVGVVNGGTSKALELNLCE